MTGRILTMLSAVAVLGFLCSCKGTGSTTAGAAGAAASGTAAAEENRLVAEYDQLATEMLKVHPNETEAQKKQEIDLIRTLLGVYKTQADADFTAAKAAPDAKAQGKALESAIEDVTKVAQEGDKRINDIKLRLQKGGHHHTKAEGSDEEYILVDPAAKKSLMGEVAKLRGLLLGANAGKMATVPDLDPIQKNVDELADKAVKAKT